jgi:hypothetical protein
MWETIVNREHFDQVHAYQPENLSRIAPHGLDLGKIANTHKGEGSKIVHVHFCSTPLIVLVVDGQSILLPNQLIVALPAVRFNSVTIALDRKRSFCIAFFSLKA